ncbi:hypothetical protein Nepgr_023355 [Nepenthes gracilis]|uniref:Protein kinase domain-containing protein n=1 Tax=Nepenthes gracilis TaxID=150966 RepID=A0AAD3T0J9_NEPGR|nr:hypothetical protein Nepgr_023355 [Nepenthes gracilis]
MESIPTKFLLSLLFSFILVAHARLSLDRSDYDAFMIVQRGLGINSQPHSFEKNPCNSHGVFCETRRISNCSSVLKITHVTVESRQLGGSISPDIGKLSELRELTLSDNHLIHQLPAQIADCRKLKVLNLKNNHLSGDVPPELSKLIRLRVLDLSSNRFSGDLSFLKHFPNLEILSLSNNLFTGNVPASLRSFRNLRFFNISGNELIQQGPAPFLNGVEYVSPQVTGEKMAPKRHMLAEKLTTRRNHSSAVAAPTASVAPAEAPAPAAVSHSHRKHEKKLRAWILGFLAGAIAGGASGMIISVLVKATLFLCRRDKDSGISIFSPLIKKEDDLKFLEKEDGLASLELIGRGGCGDVYRAQLPRSHGMMIAIKRITAAPNQANDPLEEETKQLNKRMRQIRAEIKTIGQIRHRNLLPLLAHVGRPGCHYLVYEFMKNGSLQDALNQAAEGTREFEWLARHRIAVGVAAGLEYLHFSNEPKIIHRDLKPANILIDDNMEPRISDFGLAKAMPDTKTHITTSVIAGTLGYIAPEYHQTLKFTEKCDIYSFGVMLGVLVIGRLPTDEFFIDAEEIGLVKWMINVMTSMEPKRAIDAKLIGNGYEEQMLQVLKIACFCTLDDPSQRPNSRDVRCMLSQIHH